jgi:hypothetical protein
MTITDYYEIFDLPLGSSIDEIKKAYRKKARQYHPDLNSSPDAQDLFIRITEAYEFLIANHENLMIRHIILQWKIGENTVSIGHVNEQQLMQIHHTVLLKIPVFIKLRGSLTGQLLS